MMLVTCRGWRPWGCGRLVTGHLPPFPSPSHPSDNGSKYLPSSPLLMPISGPRLGGGYWARARHPRVPFYEDGSARDQPESQSRPGAVAGHFSSDDDRDDASRPVTTHDEPLGVPAPLHPPPPLPQPLHDGPHHPQHLRPAPHYGGVRGGTDLQLPLPLPALQREVVQERQGVLQLRGGQGWAKSGALHSRAHCGVDLQRSGSRSVTLTDVSGLTTGRFRCEVSGEAPMFATDTKYADLSVVTAPASGPLITGARPSYHVRDPVSVTCTLQGSRPAANLTWYINNQQVSALCLLSFHDIIAWNQIPISIFYVGESYKNDLLPNYLSRYPRNTCELTQVGIWPPISEHWRRSVLAWTSGQSVISSGTGGGWSSSVSRPFTAFTIKSTRFLWRKSDGNISKWRLTIREINQVSR